MTPTQQFLVTLSVAGLGLASCKEEAATTQQNQAAMNAAPADSPATGAMANQPAVDEGAVPNAVNEALVTALRRHWDEGEIVEMLGFVSLFGFLNRWNDSMGTRLEPAAVAPGQQRLAGQGWTPGKHA